MPGSFTEARKRQMARLQGAKPPTARAAMAKSQAYQDAADASATRCANAAGHRPEWGDRQAGVCPSRPRPLASAKGQVQGTPRTFWTVLDGLRLFGPGVHVAD